MIKLYVAKDQMKSDKPAEGILKLFTAELEESMRKHIYKKGCLQDGMYHGSLEIFAEK